MTAFLALISAFTQLIAALPEILKLIQAMQAANEERKVEIKVADNFKSIHEAWNAKDSAKLNDIFNS
jgi:hypothetical protein